jgi:hypothetical protein
VADPKKQKHPDSPVSKTDGPARRREKRKRWVQRGQYAVEVEVEVVYPEEPIYGVLVGYFSLSPSKPFAFAWLTPSPAPASPT